MIARGIVLFAALLACASAQGQSRRPGSSEIYLGPVFSDSKSYSFEGGSSAKTDTGYGLSFGYAYNYSPNFSLGFDIAWSEQDYRTTVQPGVGNPNGVQNLSGTIESRVLRFNGTWHILASDFTPFVTGGLGWTYIDTNIPSGLPENVCWWYPWYGSYCATYIPTETTTKFSYNVGAGLRMDFGRGAFARLLVNSQYVDFGGSYGSANLTQYRIDVGTKF